MVIMSCLSVIPHKSDAKNVSLLCSTGYNCAARLISVQHDYAAMRVSFYVVRGDHHERLAVTPNLCLTNGTVVSKIWALPCNRIHWRCEGEWSPWAATLFATCGFVYRLSYNTFDRITRSGKEHPPSSDKVGITRRHSSFSAISGKSLKYNPKIKDLKYKRGIVVLVLIRNVALTKQYENWLFLQLSIDLDR